MNHDKKHEMLTSYPKAIQEEPIQTGQQSRRERRRQERQSTQQKSGMTIRVFRFNHTEYVKSLTLEAAIEYFSEECDPGVPEECTEIPAEQWDHIMLRNSEYDEELPEDHPNYMPERLPLSAFVDGTETELIASAEW